MDSDLLEQIERELAALPEGEFSIVLGSGSHVMTAVVVETEQGNKLIADCAPTWAIEENCILADHRPVMNFIAHAPAHIRAMLPVVRAALALEEAADIDYALAKLHEAVRAFKEGQR